MFKLFRSSKSSKEEKEKEKAASERERNNKENRKPTTSHYQLKNECYNTEVAPKTRRATKSAYGGESSNQRKSEFVFSKKAQEWDHFQQPHKRPRTSELDSVKFDPRATREYRDPAQHRSSRSGRAMSSYGSERQSNSSHGYSDSTIDEEESDLDRTIKTRDGRRNEDHELNEALKKAEYYREKYARAKKFGKLKEETISQITTESEEKDRTIEDLRMKLMIYERSNQFANMQYNSMPFNQMYPPTMQIPNLSYGSGPSSGGSYGYQMNFPNLFNPTRAYTMDQQHYAPLQRGCNESSNTPSSGMDPQPENIKTMRDMFGNHKTEGTDQEEDEIKEFRTGSTSSLMTTNDESSFDSNVSNLLEQETNQMSLD